MTGTLTIILTALTLASGLGATAATFYGVRQIEVVAIG